MDFQNPTMRRFTLAPDNLDLKKTTEVMALGGAFLQAVGTGAASVPDATTALWLLGRANRKRRQATHLVRPGACDARNIRRASPR
jgi:hypothetical protein